MLYTTHISVFWEGNIQSDYTVDKEFDEYIDVIKIGDKISVTLDLRSRKLEDYNTVIRTMPIYGEVINIVTNIRQNPIKNELQVEKSVVLKIDSEQLHFIFDDIKELKKDINEYIEELKKDIKEYKKECKKRVSNSKEWDNK